MAYLTNKQRYETLSVDAIFHNIRLKTAPENKKTYLRH